MTGPVIANITVHATSAGLDLRFEFPPTGQVVDLPLPERRAEALRFKAGEYLSRAARTVPRLNATPEQAGTAFDILHGGGGALMELLAAERQYLLQDAFRCAWPVWEQPGWQDPDHRLPVVQVNCRDQALPLELLPVFNLCRLGELRTHDDRAQAAARFLGFATVVRRVVAAGTDPDRLIRNDPVLPVQFLRHQRLLDAVREGEFLSTLGDVVHVDGPWPTSESEPEVSAALIEALYAGQALKNGPRHDIPVQIHHFACHCDTIIQPDDDDNYTLRLSTKSGRHRSISLGVLRRAYRERIAEDRNERRRRGIVILNACASSRTNPLTAASFAQWFVSSGHRAFIGTETDVPDGVAKGFAAGFYGRLLETRRPLGEAVVWARRDLLRDFRNPLGLLYVMYGDTDLTVERARPGVYRAMR